MGETNRFAVISSSALFLAISGFSLYKFLRYEQIDGASIFFNFLALSYVLNSLTWGGLQGDKNKDELEHHIETQSTKMSYYGLMVFSGLILFVSEGVGNLRNIENYPLLIVVGLTFVVQPFTALIYSRKYK
ncbi:hypothetical protein IMZ31_18550 [Pontibacillus sp. ALD_SL1]|uniref:hypothetical protein n=1 Tax=Pontibacillus sp. ALD_SL1 TaxID=2777185 RepID=UPI001A964517|nr:hypothetical protein [Pontibacillus sp. ALD_SL1]QST00029.1 hypothetical protein IMZ31_18550 [Pontibacillus sp. ALD_SL1]